MAAPRIGGKAEGVLLGLLRRGVPLREACERAEVSYAVVERALRPPASGALARRVRGAMSSATIADLEVVSSAASESWQAARARLEMRVVEERERLLVQANEVGP